MRILGPLPRGKKVSTPSAYSLDFLYIHVYSNADTWEVCASMWRTVLLPAMWAVRHRHTLPCAPSTATTHLCRIRKMSPHMGAPPSSPSSPLSTAASAAVASSSRLGQRTRCGDDNRCPPPLCCWSCESPVVDRSVVAALCVVSCCFVLFFAPSSSSFCSLFLWLLFHVVVIVVVSCCCCCCWCCCCCCYCC